jgi:hypothetical protein
MINNHWLRITNHDSQPLAQNNTQLFITTVCYVEPVVVDHCVLSWASGRESWWAMMSQWFWIMVCYSEPVVVNHGVLCWALWLGIMERYAKPAVMNHGFSCRGIAHHDSKQLAQYDTLWFAATGSALHTMIHNHWMLSRWLKNMVCNAEQLVANHGELCWASGCESWCAMLSQWIWVMMSYAEPVVGNHGVYHDSQPLAQHNTP